MKNNVIKTLTAVLFIVIVSVTSNVSAKSIGINKIGINDIEKSDISIAGGVEVRTSIDYDRDEVTIAGIERSKILQKIDTSKIVGNEQILENIRQINVLDTIEQANIEIQIYGGDETIQINA